MSFFHLSGILIWVLFLVLVAGVASSFLGWWLDFRHCLHRGGFYCICFQVSRWVFLVLCGCHPLFLVCFCCPGWVGGGMGWGCLLGLGHGGICSLCRICSSRLGEICMWRWSAGWVPDLSSHPPVWFRPVVCLVLVWLLWLGPVFLWLWKLSCCPCRWCPLWLCELVWISLLYFPLVLWF